jgi:hypothetical protein
VFLSPISNGRPILESVNPQYSWHRESPGEAKTLPEKRQKTAENSRKSSEYNKKMSFTTQVNPDTIRDTIWKS